jgi:membrane-bound lytic murein transglycosylase D
MRLSSSILCLLAGLLLCSTARAHFISPGEGNKTDTACRQSASASLQDKGFKDLFGPAGYNPATPYATQLNPQVMPFVEDYLKRHEKHLQKMKGWAGPYFDMMDRVLVSYGLPRELKYLAVIESNLRATALSWAGAVGPWQFMPATGRRMGLVVSSRIDERTDYLKSTQAAARYLRELYEELGDWLLVIAAYNGGPGIVNAAIRKANSRNFWQLQRFLPQESRNHVKKFISTHYIMEGSGGQTTSTKAEWEKHQQNIAAQVQHAQTNIPADILANTNTTEVQGRYHSVVVATALNMDIVLFNQLNPGFDALVNSEKGYTLRLPNDKLEVFKANRSNILYQSVISTMRSAGQQQGYPAEKPAAGGKNPSAPAGR